MNLNISHPLACNNPSSIRRLSAVPVNRFRLPAVRLAAASRTRADCHRQCRTSVRGLGGLAIAWFRAYDFAKSSVIAARATYNRAPQTRTGRILQTKSTRSVLPHLNIG